MKILKKYLEFLNEELKHLPPPPGGGGKCEIPHLKILNNF